MKKASIYLTGLTVSSYESGAYSKCKMKCESNLHAIVLSGGSFTINKTF